MANEYGLGALPPPGLEWQMGKTAASITFVNKTEAYIASESHRLSRLRELVEKVKAGNIVVTEWIEDVGPSLDVETMMATPTPQ